MHAWTRVCTCSTQDERIGLSLLSFFSWTNSSSVSIAAGAWSGNVSSQEEESESVPSSLSRIDSCFDYIAPLLLLLFYAALPLTIYFFIIPPPSRE